MSELLPDPLRFTARAMVGLGGLVEAHPERLVALLPEEVARALALAEANELALEADATAVACGIGSPLLETLVERARREVPVAAVGLVGAAPADSAVRSLASTPTTISPCISRIPIVRSRCPWRPMWCCACSLV